MENMVKMLSKDMVAVTDKVEKVIKLMDSNTVVFNGNFDKIGGDMFKMIKQNKRLKKSLIGLTIVGAAGAYVAYWKYRELTARIERLEDKDKEW